jgi:DNA-binding transcriptional MerR regulator
MSVIVEGNSYYQTAEVYRIVGISRNTLYRWLQNGILGDSERRDRRGWRLFTHEEVEILKKEASRVTMTNRSA